MSETEKVINDLNETKLILCYPQMLTPEMCVRIGLAVTNAIDLLKEQKPVKPVKEQIFSSFFGWVCGACGFSLLSDRYIYCPHCGRKMRWDERKENG